METESTNLNNTVVSVINKTIRTESISHTIQAEHITFTLIEFTMNCTGNEIACSKHGY